MQSKVSVRGPTIIPDEIRKVFKINSGTRLEWIIVDGTIIVYPLPTDPIRGSFRILKEIRGVSSESLLAECIADRERERSMDVPAGN